MPGAEAKIHSRGMDPAQHWLRQSRQRKPTTNSPPGFVTYAAWRARESTCCHDLHSEEDQFEMVRPSRSLSALKTRVAMSEWRPYFIRRKTSPSMSLSLSQTQSYHMSPSMEQGSHFSTDTSRIHGGFPNSSTHSTGSNNVWPGEEWMLQAASGLRSRPASDYNVAPPVTYDHQSYLPYPALDSERVIWVHQDSVAAQQEYPNPTTVGNQSPFVRVISPGDRFRNRPQPYPLQGGSHSFVGTSTNASSDTRYRMQPASAPSAMSLSDQPQRQVLIDNSNRQDPNGCTSGFQEGLHSRRTDKDNSMSRRQRAHLDSERKRRE